MKTITIQIKNMICLSCIQAVRQILEKQNIMFEEIGTGYAIVHVSTKRKLSLLNKKLASIDMGLIADQDECLVSRIRQSIVEYLNIPGVIEKRQNLSQYISSELAINYSRLSKLFSKYEGQSIEQYYIQLRIEKVKDLIRQGKLNNSQIASIMGYSSLQYLSGQFRKVVGVTPTQYKEEWNQFLINLSRKKFLPQQQRAISICDSLRWNQPEVTIGKFRETIKSDYNVNWIPSISEKNQLLLSYNRTHPN